MQFGKSLSIETFAEGIEQQQELTLLKDEDCDSGQGFLFARPLDVDATEAFLQEWAEERLPLDQHGLTGFAGDRRDLLRRPLELLV